MSNYKFKYMQFKRKFCLDKAVKVHSRKKIITAFGMSSCGFFFLSLSYTVWKTYVWLDLFLLLMFKKFVANGKT